MGAAYAQGVPQQCGGCWHVHGIAFTRMSEQYGSGSGCGLSFELRRLGRLLLQSQVTRLRWGAHAFVQWGWQRGLQGVARLRSGNLHYASSQAVGLEALVRAGSQAAHILF